MADAFKFQQDILCRIWTLDFHFAPQGEGNRINAVGHQTRFPIPP
jgi:hypothetical protein